MTINDIHDTSFISAKNFRSLLNAMAMPGTIEPLYAEIESDELSPAMVALLLTLCDIDTTIALTGIFDNEATRNWIAFHLNSPISDIENADFIIGDWSCLSNIGSAKIGTDEYPDRSATFLIHIDDLANKGLKLSGPGIKTINHLNLPSSEPFEQNKRYFPLGNDFYFITQSEVAAIPRTTKVEAE